MADIRRHGRCLEDSRQTVILEIVPDHLHAVFVVIGEWAEINLAPGHHPSWPSYGLMKRRVEVAIGGPYDIGVIAVSSVGTGMGMVVEIPLRLSPDMTAPFPNLHEQG